MGQPGSTPLDLFKFYVEDLKARFHDEKKVIKDILREKDFDMNPETSFKEFANIVCEDKRSASLDVGNMKLTYNALIEKAEAKEKERVKEENKKYKKLEGEFRNLLIDHKADEKSDWEEVWEKISDMSVCKEIPEERAHTMFKAGFISEIHLIQPFIIFRVYLYLRNVLAFICVKNPSITRGIWG